MIVSRNISYDGTLPTPDLDRLARETTVLAAGAHCKEGFFAPIKPRDEREQIGFAHSAALKAIEDVGFGLGCETATIDTPVLIDGLDRPLADDETRTFYDVLQEMQSSHWDAEAMLSQEELMKTLRGGFRGCKCLAGIASLGRGVVNGVLELPNRLGVTPQLAAGMLINRFRFCYVRQLSFGAHDVYVPAACWKRLSEAHAITFAEVVRRHFQRTYAGRLTREIKTRLEAELGGEDRTFTLALPPIGLYALMNAKAKDGPKGVLVSALETNAEYGRLFRAFWKETREIEPPADGWTVMTGNRELDEVSERIEQGLSDRLGRLNKAALNPHCRNGALLERYVTPIVKATASVGGALLGTAAGANRSLGPMLGGAIGAAAGWAVEQIYASVRGNLVGHIDEYRALDDSLLRAYSAEIRMGRLVDQVRDVLGRHLV